MSFDPSRAIREELMPGERLLWTGKPPAGLLFRQADIVLIPFTVMWAGFAFFWEISVIRGAAGPFFAAWGVPFVLVGLYVLVGRFFVDAFIRARRAYGLTDRRAVIVGESNFTGRKVKSVTLRSLDEVSLDESADGTGTITFGSDAGSRYPGWLVRALYPGLPFAAAPVFERIPNARDIYADIRAILDSNERQPS